MEENEKFTPEPQAKGRVVDLRIFVATVIGFALTILALGFRLGCGLGHYSAATFRETTVTNAYGLPDKFDVVVPPGKLVNADELELRTGFIISRDVVVRQYEFNITLASAAPDGLYKPMILVNGQSPGPLIEANTGDTIRVQVNNQMPNTSTSIHFHGIDQRNSTWMDGVVGITQCGIPPGRSFTYEFALLEQRGTFWYHSHAGVQYTDGLYGPIVSICGSNPLFESLADCLLLGGTRP